MKRISKQLLFNRDFNSISSDDFVEKAKSEDYNIKEDEDYY